MTRIRAFAGVFVISFSAIFVRLSGVSPSTAAVFRTAYALPLLLIGWWFVRDRDRRDLQARWLAFAAGLLLGLDLALWHRAIAAIGAGLATVLANTQVVFVAVLAWILHRERPSGMAFVTIPFAFGGVVLISGLGRPESYGADPLLGAVMGVAAGLAYALFLLTFRRSNRSLAPSVAPLLDATLGALVASLLLAPLDPHFDLTFHWPAHGWLIALAALPHVAGWLFITSALPRLPALDTSVMLLLQPMATVLWGFLMFSERLSPLQWSGASLVLASILLLSVSGATRRRPAAAETDASR